MANMKAFVKDGKCGGSVQSIPRPTLGDGEILIKVHYAAVNPADWKMVEGDIVKGTSIPGVIAGCDFAGTVEVVNGTHWKKGQKVGGWVHGATYRGIGSFAEFLCIEATLVFAVPDNITLQQASTISLAFATATQALYGYLGFSEPDEAHNERGDILVYGASTSVGLYAVQLGKLSNLRVIAVASVKNHDLLKSLGAEVTVDYHDNDWVDQVKEITKGQLRYALDTIAEEGSSEKVVATLACSDGAKLMALSPVDKDSLYAINPCVKAESMMAFTVFGKALGDEYAMFDHAGPPTPNEKVAWEKHLRLVTGMLERGDLKPNPVKQVGTLTDVGEAFRLIKEGKLSAEKAVLRIADGE
ncbi:ToxD-like protein [Fusarium heterosporum]|uniref:ToxD-like protein n=1 Tax=Fusarium heterosporum TaxID=42747 RepID=A0A8H5TF48_FUSHE|nr:ToxD-like protein [Fusarium heterosporum]